MPRRDELTHHDAWFYMGGYSHVLVCRHSFKSFPRSPLPFFFLAVPLLQRNRHVRSEILLRIFMHLNTCQVPLQKRSSQKRYLSSLFLSATTIQGTSANPPLSLCGANVVILSSVLAKSSFLSQKNTAVVAKKSWHGYDGTP